MYLVGFGVGLWAASIVVPPPVRYALWAAGLAADFATPWVGRLRGILQGFPLSTSHLPERFGLFTIIVLGEAILGVVSGMSEVRWQVTSIATAALAFVIAVCIRWVYFTFVDEAPFLRNLGSGQPYIYSHLPIVVGVVIIGVGMEHAIVEAAQPMLKGETLRLIGVGIVLWLVAFLVLLLANVRQLPLRRTLGTCAAVVVATGLITTFVAYLPPVVVVAALTFVFVELVLIDLYFWETGQHGQPARLPSGGATRPEGAEARRE